MEDDKRKELEQLFLEYYNNKDWENALKCINELIKLYLKESKYYNNRGTLYYNLGKYEEAEEDFNKAIEINPNYSDVYNNRGALYLKLKKYEEAKEDFNKSIEINLNDSEAYNNRGTLYCYLGKYKEAEEDYTKSIEINPSYLKVYNNKALLYLYLYLYLLKNEQEEIKYISYFIENKNNLYINIFEKFLFKVNDINNFYNINKFDNELLNKLLKLNKIYMELINQNISNKVSSLKNEELKNNLYKLYSISEEILDINKFTFNNDHKELAHYTKQDLAITIFSDKNSRLRLNNSSYANDPEEGELFKTLINFSKETRKVYNKGNVYIACFSTNIDKYSSLPMWVNYSNQTTGCALIFDNQFFKLEKDDFIYSYSMSNDSDKYLDKATKRNKELSYIELYKIVYLNEDGQIDIKTHQQTYEKVEQFKEIYKKIINNLSELNEEDQSIVDEIIYDIVQYTSFIFKAKHFEYEEEVRIIKRIDIDDEKIKTIEGYIPKFYAEIDREINPKEVILGSKCQDKESMATFLYNKGIKKVTQSKLKYK